MKKYYWEKIDSSHPESLKNYCYSDVTDERLWLTKVVCWPDSPLRLAIFLKRIYVMATHNYQIIANRTNANQAFATFGYQEINKEKFEKIQSML